YTSTELRTLAAEIFILIRDAYRKLGDEPSRQRLLATLGHRPSVKVPVLRRPDDPPPAPAAVPPVGPPVRTPTPPRPSQPSLVPRSVATERPGGDPTAFQRGAERRAPTAGGAPAEDNKTDFRAAEALIDSGKYDEALAVYKIHARKTPGDRGARAGMELVE